MNELQKFILTLLLISLVSCSKISDSVPDCIKEKIKDETCITCVTQLDEYELDGQLVYVFDYSLAVCGYANGVIYDKNCNEVCHFAEIPDKLKCTNINFWERAEFIGTIWER